MHDNNYEAFSELKKIQIELYNSINKKIKIYLDMNYWIEFLKYLNNLKVRPYTEELYELILKLVNENKITIPISDIHLYESYKNRDQYKYESLIKLMEKMSQNVCFVSMDQRWSNELIFCLRLLFGIPNSNELLNHELWTKPFFLKGDKIPSFQNIPFESSNKKIEMQKSFINFSWDKSLSDIYLLLNDSVRQELDPSEYEKKITEYLTNGRENNKNDFKNFKDLLGKEIWGSLEFSESYIKTLVADYFDNYHVGTSPVADSFYKMDKNERHIRLMYSITESIVESKEYGVLPALTVGSCLHSLKRWEIGSHYKNNDTFDFMHAKIALPYCEYFFTDRNLRGLIKDNHIKLDEVFKCKVICDIEDAYNTLNADSGINDT